MRGEAKLVLLKKHVVLNRSTGWCIPETGNGQAVDLIA
jgi:hypothetical protein